MCNMDPDNPKNGACRKEYSYATHGSLLEYAIPPIPKAPYPRKNSYIGENNPVGCSSASQKGKAHNHFLKTDLSVSPPGRLIGL